MVDRKEKLVSVIVPVHNAEKYLEEAVESVGNRHTQTGN